MNPLPFSFISFSEVLQNISFNWTTKIIDRIELVYTDKAYKEILGVNISWSLVPQYPSCQIINIQNYFFDNSKSIRQILVNLGNIENLEVTLKFQEFKRTLKRSLKSNLLAYNGPSLTIKDPREREIRAIVKMSQEIHSDKDKDARCTNYPNENYEDYNECDETNVHNRVKLYYNITPVWATRDSDSVTKQRKFLQVLKKQILHIF